MVAQLDKESMQFVVRGENGDDSVGLIACAVMLRPNSYDHSRHHDAVVAAKADAAKGAPTTVVEGLKKGSAKKRSPRGTSSPSAATAQLLGSARVARRSTWTHSMPRGDQSKLNHHQRGMAKARVEGRTVGTRTSTPTGNCCSTPRRAKLFH